MARPIRVLVAKPGLDGHDRGALIVAQGLRDAGMEVIYTGLRQTPEQIVAAAIDEDVDCVGLSSLSGAHMALFPAVVEGLRSAGADEILVIGGGVIPPDDIEALTRAGLSAVFTPGSPIADMAAYIRAHVRRAAGGATPFAPPAAIDHIGVAVESVERALPLYRDMLGFAPEGEETIPDQGVRMLFLRVGESHVELLEPIGADSPVRGFLQKRGEGLHHVAYRVDDVAAWLARAAATGYRLIDENPRRGGRGRLVGFVHPGAAHGVLIEFCQGDPAVPVASGQAGEQ